MPSGIKVSSRGIDVNSAADHELVFSTGIPNLSMYKRIVLTVAAHSLSSKPMVSVYYHGLGYYPFFMAMRESDDAGKYNLGFTDVKILVDDERVYYNGDVPVDDDTTYIIYLFHQDMFTEYNSESFSLASRGGEREATHGIKVPRRSIAMDSEDPRDFVVNTSFKTMPIHKAGSLFIKGNSGFGLYEVRHDLGYPPIFLLYRNALTFTDTVAYQLIRNVPGTEIVTPVHKVTSTSLFINSAGPSFDQTYPYIIFKDPI